MKILNNLIIVSVFLISFASCKKDSRPNYEYMPNMYESVGYEAYQEAEIFAGDVEAQIPVKGTIPRGYSLFEIPNTTEGYELAKNTLRSPLDSTKVDDIKTGQLYQIYCAICHGNNGKGQGNLVKREKILGVPSYADRDITIGSIYHTIYYGKNAMGSYANQLNEKERWEVAQYVMKLRSEIK